MRHTGALKIPFSAALERAIWDIDKGTLPPWKARLVHAGRIAWDVVRDLSEGQLTLHAMSLVYTTLLSLVPLLALSFSVLKAFGVHEQLEPTLLRLFEPLGEQGVELAGQIVESVGNMQVGILGAVGLTFLIYTVVALIQKIERAFNYSWHTTQARGLARRFTDYLSVILVGPVILFSALGFVTSALSYDAVAKLLTIEPLGRLVSIVESSVPFLLAIAGFTFIYLFVPNTRVRLRSAFVAALVAGTGWHLLGRGFASIVVSSARYTAFYSGFAIVIVFMIWLYLSWLILLLGAAIAFYHQHPEFLAVERHELTLSARMKEKLALTTLHLIGSHHFHRKQAWTGEGLAKQLDLPIGALLVVLDTLVKSQILTLSSDQPPAYLPARALETVPVREALRVVRSAEEGPHLNPDRIAPESAVLDVEQRVQEALNGALSEISLKDLALHEAIEVNADELESDA